MIEKSEEFMIFSQKRELLCFSATRGAFLCEKWRMGLNKISCYWKDFLSNYLSLIKCRMVLRNPFLRSSQYVFYDGEKVAEEKKKSIIHYFVYLLISLRNNAGYLLWRACGIFIPSANTFIHQNNDYPKNHKSVRWEVCEKNPESQSAHSLNLGPLWATPQSERSIKRIAMSVGSMKSTWLPCVLHWSKHWFSCSWKRGRNFFKIPPPSM